MWRGSSRSRFRAKFFARCVESFFSIYYYDLLTGFWGFLPFQPLASRPRSRYLVKNSHTRVVKFHWLYLILLSPLLLLFRCMLRIFPLFQLENSSSDIKFWLSLFREWRNRYYKVVIFIVLVFFCCCFCLFFSSNSCRKQAILPECSLACFQSQICVNIFLATPKNNMEGNIFNGEKFIISKFIASSSDYILFYFSLILYHLFLFKRSVFVITIILFAFQHSSISNHFVLSASVSVCLSISLSLPLSHSLSHFHFLSLTLPLSHSLSLSLSLSPSLSHTLSFSFSLFLSLFLSLSLPIIFHFFNISS